MIENIVAEISAPLYPRHVKELGERAKKRREELGLIQEQVADAAGVNIETVNRIEHGHNTTIKKLRAIAKGLRTTVGNLLPEDQWPDAMKPAPDAACEEHAYLHVMLEEILHQANREWIYGITANIKAHYRSATGKEPLTPGHEGKYPPEGQFETGDLVGTTGGQEIKLGKSRSNRKRGRN